MTVVEKTKSVVVVVTAALTPAGRADTAPIPKRAPVLVWRIAFQF
ncbi:MAG: hypothetical protein OXC26_10075 [Albidovulum sp.]|nr:hypothetical protein [Albidovulum sp.]